MWERLRKPLSPIQVIVVLVIVGLIVAGYFFWRSRQQPQLGPPPGMEVPAYPIKPPRQP